MKRPKVTVRPARLSRVEETLVEFTFPDGSGGLISFRTANIGPAIELYRLDPSVFVYVPKENRID